MHLHVSELPLDDTERVFDLGSDAGLQALELLDQRIDLARLVQRAALAGVVPFAVEP